MTTRVGAVAPAVALAWALTACAPAVSAPSPAPADPASPGSPADPRVDALLAEYDRPDAPGAAVLVVRDGAVVHARGYGLASLEHGVPIGPGTVFDIASISKQFAALAIAMLAAEGALSLDDEVRTYIPELPDFGAPIRVRHLVHHTSGLRDWPGTLRMAGWDWMDVLSYDQILNMAYHQRALNFPPGSDHAYSNTGYNLMAEIVARVTGESFREWTDRRIFAPLGMTRTHFHDDHTEVVAGRAESYAPRPEGGWRRLVSSLTALGSSSLFTTIEDLARWDANFDHAAVGGRAVVDGMTERGVLTSGDTIDYAFGLVVDAYRGVPSVRHGGSWAGYRTLFLRLPAQRLTVVVLANRSDMNAGALGHRIADLFLDERLPARVAAEPGDPPAGPPAPPASAAAEPYRPDAAALREYEGEYRSDELATSYRLRLEGGELALVHFRIGRVPLRPVAPDVFQAPGMGRVEFERDGRGGVVAFTANSVRIRGLRFDRQP